MLIQEEAAAGEWAALLSYDNAAGSSEGLTVEDLNKVRSVM